MVFAVIRARLQRVQDRLSAVYGSDISTPEARRAAWWHFQLSDHAFLRLLWTNFAEVAPGVFRANQPSPERLASYHAKGIRTILNLRGRSNQSFYLFEAEACARLGMTLIDVPLSARFPPPLAALEQLNTLFTSMEKPFLIHCKSGSDRTGTVAALYLLIVEGKTVAEAAQQVSFRYLHVANSVAGVQDHFLRFYAQAHAKTGIGFMQWARSEYDPQAVIASFARWRAGDRRVPL